MNKKRWWVTWVMVAMLSLSAVPMMSGCLTPDQRTAVTEAGETAAELDLLLAGLQAKIDAVRVAVKESRTPFAEGQALIKGLMEKRYELLSIKDRIGTSIAALRDADTPWYGYIPGALSVLLSVGGSVLGVGKVGNVLSAFGGVSRGLENVLEGMNTTDAEKAKAKLMAHVVESDAKVSAVRELHAKALAKEI